MGANTLNSYFYKPSLGASGAAELALFDAKLDVADAEIKASKDVKHTQGTDQGLDTGGANAVVVADVKDAVTKKHTQNTDTDLDATFEATFAKKADKLSAFAATTSAELAGVISDEIGAGKLRFDTAVTAKTTTATLTVAEAGTILVSAAAAYTITLPTAVGNTGLTYHFIKTDANYFLITLDGDGTETLNYENSTGTPNLTYARLNTYCAEVTIVSDGANWQCINERLGQVPKFHVWEDAAQVIPTADWLKVNWDTEVYDIGNNFDITTNDRFVAPISGYYQFIGMITYGTSTVVDKYYYVSFKVNNTTFIFTDNEYCHVATTEVGRLATVIYHLNATDYIEMFTCHNSGADCPLAGTINGNFFGGILIEKD